MQLPPSTGYSGQANFPVASVPPNLHLTVTYSNEPPKGLTPFAIARKPASAQRSPLDALSTDVVYACFAANYLVEVDGGPKFVFNLPPGFATSEVVYNLAIAQNGTWTDGYGGPGTVVANASSATVSVTGRFGFLIPANGLVCTALLGRSTSAPTPVPATPPPNTSPSASASASASTLRVTAAPVAISSSGGVALTVGASDTLSIAPADAPATATTTCGTGSIATLAGSPGATFTLTGTAVGTCALTLTNAAGKTNTISVTIAAVPTLGVTAAPIAISGAGLALTVGATDTLSIAGADAPATATTTCGTGSIATLSGSPGATFALTGTAVGTCALTLTNGAGKTDTITVTVAARPPSASPSPSSMPSVAPSVSPSASPTPSPTSTPTPTPTPTPTVAPSPAGNVYVADQDGYITKYTPSGTSVLSFQTSSNDPLGVAVDSTGKIYTANQTGSDLLIYNANGTSAGTIATGAGPQYPAIAPNGIIWTSTSTSADGPHGSVEAFNAGGTRVATVTAGLYGPYGVAVDQSGKVYVANNGGGNVTTYTGSGAQTTPTITINSAFAVAAGPNGKVYVVNGQGLSVYNADGSSSSPSLSGSFYSVAVDNAGNIYLLQVIVAFPSGSTTCFEYMYSASGVQIGSPFSVSNHCDGIAVH